MAGKDESYIMQVGPNNCNRLMEELAFGDGKKLPLLFQQLSELDPNQQYLILSETVRDIGSYNTNRYMTNNNVLMLALYRFPSVVPQILDQMEKLTVEQRSHILMQTDYIGRDALDLAILRGESGGVDLLFQQIKKFSPDQQAKRLECKSPVSNIVIQGFAYFPSVLKTLLAFIKDFNTADKKKIIDIKALTRRQGDFANIILKSTPENVDDFLNLLKTAAFSAKEIESFMLSNPGFNSLRRSYYHELNPELAQIDAEKSEFPKEFNLASHAFYSTKNPEKVRSLLSFINTLDNKDVQNRLLSGLGGALYGIALTDAKPEKALELLLQIEQLPPKILVELYQCKGLAAAEKQIVPGNNPELKRALFKAEIQTGLAMINQKIKHLPEGNPDRQLIAQLQKTWEQYKQSPNVSKLQEEFSSALDKAKPVFVKTSQGTGILNFIKRAWDYLFNNADLIKKEEKSFTEIQTISKQFKKEMSELRKPEGGEEPAPISIPK